MTESKYDWYRPAPIPADHSIRLRAEIHALKNELAQAYEENRYLRRLVNDSSTCGTGSSVDDPDGDDALRRFVQEMIRGNVRWE